MYITLKFVIDFCVDMDKFLIKRKPIPDQSPVVLEVEDTPPTQVQPALKRNRVENDHTNLPADPGLRPRMSDYPPNEQESVRRSYLQKGPFQPRQHKFPLTLICNKLRKFNASWFNDGGDWLEYSIHDDAIFCLHCYLFRPDHGEQGGGDSFVVKGFRNWKNRKALQSHVGGPNSAHNHAYRQGQALLNQKQQVGTLLCRQSDKVRSAYRLHLQTVVDCSRFLLRQGLAFRGHDESPTSSNPGNFLGLLKFTENHNDSIKDAIRKSPRNLSLTSPEIQKDIVNSTAVETTNAILKELGDSFFSILVDESRDISIKEQMAVVLRFVKKDGCLVERFLGIVHVEETSALSLKVAIDSLFCKHGLCISRLRGQGYDGASNMQGQFNGLKAIIMKENGSAFYVHCFAHQLQLALVAVAKNITHVALFFNLVSSAVNTCAASCKRREILMGSHNTKVLEAVENGELATGQGLNQEVSLKRPGDTRWGSHYATLVRFLVMFPSVIEVLERVVEDGLNSEQRGEASALLESLQSFDFIFILHLMRRILGITNDLSKALQRSDQDITNAMTLVKVSKQLLQTMRDDEWGLLITDVSSFCTKNIITIPNMEDKFVARGRSRRNAEEMTNLHYYRVGLFYKCIDWQLLELNSRFDKVNTELLLCLACLNPSNSFVAFDKKSLIRLAEFYPSDFSSETLMILHDQLDNYITDVRSNREFSELKGISDLVRKMVETKKSIVYPLVFLLMTLSLILPVATATVERAFSAMHIIKNRLRNRMGDGWLNDCLVTYIERDIFYCVDDEAILQRFQKMRHSASGDPSTRRGQL